MTTGPYRKLLIIASIYRAIVRHSVPIIYAQLDVGIDTAQATCNTCRSINNTATGAIDASLIHRKGYRPSALDVSLYSPLSWATNDWTTNSTFLVYFVDLGRSGEKSITMAR